MVPGEGPGGWGPGGCKVRVEAPRNLEASEHVQTQNRVIVCCFFFFFPQQHCSRIDSCLGDKIMRT